MFYIGLTGGLGNQMFQYAFGVAASLESGIPLALDLYNFGKEGPKYTPRTFQLHHFNIQAKVASELECARFHTKKAWLFRKIKERLNRTEDHVFNPRALQVKHNQYLQGLWQSEKYFKKYSDTIRRELSLKEPLGMEALTVANEIAELKKNNIVPVMVHVRRGDFVTNAASISLLGVLGEAYFTQGVEHIYTLLQQKNPGVKLHLFIASEDTKWVEQNVKFHHPVTYISRPGIYDFEEIILMSHCDHFVISNSTFSWWAAWLSQYKEKIVVAPKVWMQGNPNVKTDDLVPESWHRI